MNFKYKLTKRPDGSLVKTPSIPVTMIGKKDAVEVIALIDSGADISVIPKEMAEILGFNLKRKSHKSFGIGGEVDSIEDSMKIIVNKGHEKYVLEIPILIILDKYSFPPLLGRAGFFDYFKIQFDQQRYKVTLKKVTEKNF